MTLQCVYTRPNIAAAPFPPVLDDDGLLHVLTSPIRSKVLLGAEYAMHHCLVDLVTVAGLSSALVITQVNVNSCRITVEAVAVMRRQTGGARRL